MLTETFIIRIPTTIALHVTWQLATEEKTTSIDIHEERRS